MAILKVRPVVMLRTGFVLLKHVDARRRVFLGPVWTYYITQRVFVLGKRHDIRPSPSGFSSYRCGPMTRGVWREEVATEFCFERRENSFFLWFRLAPGKVRESCPGEVGGVGGRPPPLSAGSGVRVL